MAIPSGLAYWTATLLKRDCELRLFNGLMTPSSRSPRIRTYRCPRNAERNGGRPTVGIAPDAHDDPNSASYLRSRSGHVRRTSGATELCPDRWTRKRLSVRIDPCRSEPKAFALRHDRER